MEEAVKLRRYLASLVVYSKVLSVSDGRDNWQTNDTTDCSNIQQDLPRELEKTVQKFSLKIVQVVP